MSILTAARAAARTAFATAKAGEVLTTCRVRLLPSAGAYNPTTDTTATVWGFDKAEVDALRFDDKEAQEQDAGGPESRMLTFLVLGEAMAQPDTTLVDGEQEGLIDEGGRTWHVTFVETDPTKTVWLFQCRR